MAETIGLPEGFELDNHSLPQGFVLDQQPKQQNPIDNSDPYKAEREDLNEKLRLGFQGLSFGSGSSIIAGAKTLGIKGARAIEKGVYGDNMIPDTTYSQQKQEADTNLEKARKDQGFLGDLALEGIGGMGTGGAILDAAEAGASKVIASSPLAKKLASSIPNALKGAAEAGGLSAVYGAGESKGQTVGTVAKDAATSGLAGAILGAAAPAVGSVLKKGATAVARTIGINPSAEGILSKTLTPKDAQDALDKLNTAQTEGSRTSLLETGNRKIDALAKRVAEQPTEGADALNQQIVQRAQESTEATKNILKGIGNAGNYYGDIDNVIDQRAKASSPLFDKSYQEGANIPENDNLSIMLGDDRIQSALNKARKDFGIKSPDNSVEALHGARQVIDDTIGTAYQQGENNKARAYSKLRGELNDVIYDASPTFKQADNTFAGYSNIKNAYEDGAAFSSYKTPEEFQRVLEKHQDNPSQLEGLKNGVVQDLLQKSIDISGQTPNPAQKIIGSELNKQKLQLLFNNPDEYNQVTKKLNDEVAIVNTKARVVGKEPSALTPADDKAFTEYAIMNPTTGAFHLKVIDALGNTLMRKYHGLDEKNSADLAKILTDPKASIDALTKIAAKGNPDTKRAVIDLLPKVIGAKLGGTFINPGQSKPEPQKSSFLNSLNPISEANAEDISNPQAAMQMAQNDYKEAAKTTHYEPTPEELKQLADQKLERSVRDRYKEASKITHYIPDQEELKQRILR